MTLIEALEYDWDALELLARRLGGQRIYLPRKGGHPLVAPLLGERSAWVHAAFAGGRVDIPTYAAVAAARAAAARREHARRLLAAGQSNRQIAAATGLSRRTVARLRASRRGRPA